MKSTVTMTSRPPPSTANSGVSRKSSNKTIKIFNQCFNRVSYCCELLSHSNALRLLAALTLNLRSDQHRSCHCCMNCAFLPIALQLQSIRESNTQCLFRGHNNAEAMLEGNARPLDCEISLSTRDNVGNCINEILLIDLFLNECWCRQPSQRAAGNVKLRRDQPQLQNHKDQKSQSTMGEGWVKARIGLGHCARYICTFEKLSNFFKIYQHVSAESMENTKVE